MDCLQSLLVKVNSICNIFLSKLGPLTNQSNELLSIVVLLIKPGWTHGSCGNQSRPSLLVNIVFFILPSEFFFLWDLNSTKINGTCEVLKYFSTQIKNMKMLDNMYFSLWCEDFTFLDIAIESVEKNTTYFVLGLATSFSKGCFVGSSWFFFFLFYRRCSHVDHRFYCVDDIYIWTLSVSVSINH